MFRKRLTFALGGAVFGAVSGFVLAGPLGLSPVLVAAVGALLIGLVCLLLGPFLVEVLLGIFD